MIYYLVALPERKTLDKLNSVRDYVYQNGFRFKNKKLGTNTHITLTQISLEDRDIKRFYEFLQSKISDIISFSVSQNNWVLTKENKLPNNKCDQTYAWVALKFSQVQAIYLQTDKLADDFGVNNNNEYINDIKLIEKGLPDNECIANHINLSNYTRPDKADECWAYFNENLPKEIYFDRIALIDFSGTEIFNLKLK